MAGCIVEFSEKSYGLIQTSLNFSDTLLNCFLSASEPLLVSASIDSCQIKSINSVT